MLAAKIMCLPIVLYSTLGRAAEMTPSALVCHLTQGIFSSFEAGKFSPFEAANGFDVTFAAIDVVNHTAQLIGNLGAAKVSAIKTDAQLFFLEETAMGNFNTTSVAVGEFAGLGERTQFPAVQSRHVQDPISDLFMISQYVGFCEARY
jgi:hypothetical protein